MPPSDALAVAAKKMGLASLKDKQKEVILRFVGSKDVFVSLPLAMESQSSTQSRLRCMRNFWVSVAICFIFVSNIKLHVWYCCDYVKSNPTTGTTVHIAICVSLLTTLMTDQRDKFQAGGVLAEYVCEKQKDTHILEKVSSGGVQLVFISPESIGTSYRYHQMLASPCYQVRLG